VLDDEAVVGELVAAVLKSRGYPALVANCCADAERLIRERNGGPALLISDVMMPDMTGPEFVRKLREQGVRLPVIYISGYAGADPLANQEVCRQQYFLLKPFSAAELLEIVEEALAAEV
jgi:DNA-binding NtrC family response regulator